MKKKLEFPPDLTPEEEIEYMISSKMNPDDISDELLNYMNLKREDLDELLK